jgi:ketosteroid isomerase-like protein
MTSQPSEATAADVESVVRRYYAVVADLSSGAPDLEPLLAPGVRITEHPNALTPDGAVRDRDAVLAGFLAGKTLLREQDFDLHEVVVQGDHAAARLTWRGVIGIDAGPFTAGQELVAEIASFLTVRDGQVVEHETFDCYRPFA